jgi:hypothetical protein
MSQLHGPAADGKKIFLRGLRRPQFGGASVKGRTGTQKGLKGGRVIVRLPACKALKGERLETCLTRQSCSGFR